MEWALSIIREVMVHPESRVDTIRTKGVGEAEIEDENWHSKRLENCRNEHLYCFPDMHLVV